MQCNIACPGRTDDGIFCSGAGSCTREGTCRCVTAKHSHSQCHDHTDTHTQSDSHSAPVCAVAEPVLTCALQPICYSTHAKPCHARVLLINIHTRLDTRCTTAKLRKDVSHTHLWWHTHLWCLASNTAICVKILLQFEESLRACPAGERADKCRSESSRLKVHTLIHSNPVGVHACQRVMRLLDSTQMLRLSSCACTLTCM
jgi:hypothetical protein